MGKQGILDYGEVRLMAENIGNYAKHAAIWDWSGYDRTKEFEFWCNLAEPYGKKALSAMCAIGEAGAYMVGKGFDVTALDITKEMIEEGRCRYKDLKNLKFVCSDVRNFELADKTYDFAFIGSTDLHHMQTEEDMIKVLTSIHQHLRSSGGLGLELWYPSESSWTSPKRKFEPLNDIADSAVKVWKEGQTDYDAENQVVTISQEVYIQAGNDVEHFTHAFKLQLFSRELLLKLLNECGYKVKQEYGGYNLESWEPGSSKWIVEAERL